MNTLLLSFLIALCTLSPLFSLKIHFFSSHYLNAYELPDDFSSLSKSEKALIRDLLLLNFPPFNWRQGVNRPKEDSTLDVVIIGAGMAGLTAGAALFKEGVYDIKIFDQSPMGLEGPWITYARMNTLRSDKEIMGPALDIPHLTFHAWYEAVYGAEAWKQLVKIPTPLWMDYLNWYREVLQLPVENHCLLTDLVPKEGRFELHFKKNGQNLNEEKSENGSFVVRARKVVLATGRTGFGGATIPEYAKDLPKSVCAHTIDFIDFESLKDRRIGIIGVGASSFDAAGTALELGARSVDMIMRRSQLPDQNKFASVPYKGFSHGYFKLSDELKWKFMTNLFEGAIPPPIESIKRVEGYSNFKILANRVIYGISYDGSEINITTNKGTITYDFLILATGFNVNGKEQPELSRVIDAISLWKDYLPSDAVTQNPKIALFPYVGPSYEFVSKEAGADSYLKNLYCFNYAATLSHGLLSGDILGISIGATRLAQGIVADFFIQNSDWYLNALENEDEKDFEEGDYLLDIQ